MNWTGLLVEANPVLVRRLLSKNRNVSAVSYTQHERNGISIQLIGQWIHIS